jgi:hypothetical protein
MAERDPRDATIAAAAEALESILGLAHAAELVLSRQ